MAVDAEAVGDAHEAPESRCRPGPNTRSAWNVRKDSSGNADGRPRRPSERQQRLLRALLLLDHHGLDRRGDAALDLDHHHARAHRLDRLVEVYVAPVDRDAARALDGVD